MIQNLLIKDYHEFHVRLYKNLEMPILEWCKYSLKIKGAFMGEKKYINGEKFLLRIMWFFKWWPQVISHHPFKPGVYRTCDIEDITFLIYHETKYSHMIKELCNFVRGMAVSEAITLSILVSMDLREIKK